MEVKELQSRIQGKVIAAINEGYENFGREHLWNRTGLAQIFRSCE